MIGSALRITVEHQKDHQDQGQHVQGEDTSGGRGEPYHSHHRRREQHRHPGRRQVEDHLMQTCHLQGLVELPSWEHLPLIASVKILAFLAKRVRVAGIYNVDQHELVVRLDQERSRRERRHQSQNRYTGGRPLPNREFDDAGLDERLEVQRDERDLPGPLQHVPHDSHHEREERHATPGKTRQRVRLATEHERAEGVNQRPREHHAEEEVPGVEAREHHRVNPGEEQNGEAGPFHSEPLLSIRFVAASSPSTRSGSGQRPIARTRAARATTSARVVHRLDLCQRPPCGSLAKKARWYICNAYTKDKALPKKIRATRIAAWSTPLAASPALNTAIFPINPTAGGTPIRLNAPTANAAPTSGPRNPATRKSSALFNEFTTA